MFDRTKKSGSQHVDQHVDQNVDQHVDWSTFSSTLINFDQFWKGEWKTCCFSLFGGVGMLEFLFFPILAPGGPPGGPPGARWEEQKFKHASLSYPRQTMAFFVKFSNGEPLFLVRLDRLKHDNLRWSKLALGFAKKTLFFSVFLDDFSWFRRFSTFLKKEMKEYT